MPNEKTILKDSKNTIDNSPENEFGPRIEYNWDKTIKFIKNPREIIFDTKDKSLKIKFLNFEQAGKGFAIIQGFKYALEDKKNFELIGFVDSDMSTKPKDFYDLVENIGNYGGIMASRYVKGAVVSPKQPFMVKVSRNLNMQLKP